MTHNEELIFQQALVLPPLEKAALVEQLLRSFDISPAETADIEAAWVAEANDRMTAYRNGEISSQSEDELFAEINRKYGA